MRVWVTFKLRHWKGTSKQERRGAWGCSLGTLGSQKEEPAKEIRTGQWSGQERWKPRAWRAEHQVRKHFQEEGVVNLSKGQQVKLRWDTQQQEVIAALDSSCLKACLDGWLADLVMTLLCQLPGLGIPVTSTAVPIQPHTTGFSLRFSLNTCTSQILNSSVTSSVLSALPFFISLLMTRVIGLPWSIGIEVIGLSWKEDKQEIQARFH